MIIESDKRPIRKIRSTDEATDTTTGRSPTIVDAKSALDEKPPFTQSPDVAKKRKAKRKAKTKTVAKKAVASRTPEKKKRGIPAGLAAYMAKRKAAAQGQAPESTPKIVRPKQTHGKARASTLPTYPKETWRGIY